MLKTQKEMTKDIHNTVDQLILNAEILGPILYDEEFDDEVCALLKTQESLMAHFVHLQTLLYGVYQRLVKDDRFLKKLMRLSQLNQYIEKAQTAKHKRGKVSSLSKAKIGRSRRKSKPRKIS